MPRDAYQRGEARGLVLAVLMLSLLASGSPGQGAKKSDAVVKVSARAGKPGQDGKQLVSITLVHDSGWHTYANPVGNKDLEGAQTSVSFGARIKPADVTVDYPAGKLIKDKLVGDYLVYEGQVALKATVRRAKDDTGPLEVTVKLQACNDKTCLLPATVKVKAE